MKFVTRFAFKTQKFLILRNIIAVCSGILNKVLPLAPIGLKMGLEMMMAEITGDSDKLVSWFVQTTARKNRPFQNRLICFYYFSEWSALSGCSLYASLSVSPVIYDDGKTITFRKRPKLNIFCRGEDSHWRHLWHRPFKRGLPPLCSQRLSPGWPEYSSPPLLWRH